MATAHVMKGVRRGDSFRRSFVFKDRAGQTVDVSDLDFVFRTVGRGAGNLIEKATETGGLERVDASTLELHLNEAETALLTLGRTQSFTLRCGDQTVIYGTFDVQEGLRI